LQVLKALPLSDKQFTARFLESRLAGCGLRHKHQTTLLIYKTCILEKSELRKIENQAHTTKSHNDDSGESSAAVSQGRDNFLAIQHDYKGVLVTIQVSHLLPIWRWCSRRLRRLRRTKSGTWYNCI